MRAIILTFDRRAGLARLVIDRYLELWPDAPLRFHVPWNGESNPELAFFKASPRVVLTPSASDIRGTMTALLDGLPEEEFVYWCIDDRYPLQLLEPEVLPSIADFLGSGEARDIDAIKVFWWKERTAGAPRRIGGLDYMPQSDRSLWGFWHHHFIRVGLLRRVFFDSRLPAGYSIHDVNRLFHGAFQYQTILVPARNIMTFGEPLVGGELTQNGLQALQQHGCHVPDYPVSDAVVTFTHTAAHRGVSKFRSAAPPGPDPAP